MKSFFKLNQKRKRGIHRTKRSLKMNVKEFFYPSIGVRAWVKYIFLALNRKPLSSHKIALGFAVGVFVSFTPYLGLHGLLAILISSVLSASIFAALMGTLIGNPWTFPLFFRWSSKLGHLILYQECVPIKLNANLEGGLKAYFSFENMLHYWKDILYPMTIGGIPLGIAFGFVFYFIIKCHIDKYRAIRVARMEKARAKIRAQRIQKIKNTFKIK